MGIHVNFSYFNGVFITLHISYYRIRLTCPKVTKDMQIQQNFVKHKITRNRENQILTIFTLTSLQYILYFYFVATLSLFSTAYVKSTFLQYFVFWQKVPFTPFKSVTAEV